MLKKKILCGLLAGVLLCFTGCQASEDDVVDEPEIEVIPISAAISSSSLQFPATNDLFYYNVYDDYIAITKYLGEETFLKKEDGFTVPKNIVIPDTIDGLPVYVIGPEAFKDSTFETVQISKNVVTIGASAFADCQHLREVTFSDVTKTIEGRESGSGVVTLEASAFSGCENLETITLPDSLETIGESVFANCLSLKKINIPSLVTVIPSYFCLSCESLKDIYITDSVVEIEDSAFIEVAPDAQIYGGVYSQSAHYAAEHFMLFVINREKNDVKPNASPGETLDLKSETVSEVSSESEENVENIKKEEEEENNNVEGRENA